ncbi:MAG: HlyD family type I secretion periplasmic adaptor subunit [Porticoccaceae bacterium]
MRFNALLEALFDVDSSANQRRVDRLANFHNRNYSIVLNALLIGLVVFVIWANTHVLDQVARAQGEVIASNRVQVIQVVDGGVLETLNVREGDRVAKGQVIASLEQGRIGASVAEVAVRLCALQAQRARLVAEVTSQPMVEFDNGENCSAEQAQIESALFEQRRDGLAAELNNLTVAVKLGREELELVRELSLSGDVNRSEVIRTERALNEAEAKVVQRKNRFFEEANTALAKVEDEIAQNEQILKQREEQLDAIILRAPLAGIVKNVRVTTVGGVLRAGDELMQLIPVDDELIIEAKVAPTDIALVRTGMQAMLRFDPFDYTIFGGVLGTVRYVSPDTLKEESRTGEEIYYRVHVAITNSPVETTTGHPLEILPGMTAQVDIRTGERTFMAYLLKPLRKTLTTALGER